jgi:cytochrome c-type biogenesis protein CcmH/NrfG
MTDTKLGQGWQTGTAVDDRLFQEALEAWNSGAPQHILPKLERALPHSRDYRLWHIHGLILRALERREDALPSLRRAVELNPNAPNPARALAQTVYEAGLPSLDAYALALRLAPGDEELLTGLAMALVANGEVKSAIAGLQRSVGRSPHWTAGHILLSKLRWMEGERTGFTRSFEEARRQHPRAPDLWLQQLLALVNAEQWDDALRVIAEGRATIGNQLMFDVNEAVIRSSSGHPELAEALFESFEGLDDQPVQVHRVRQYLRTGRVERAGDIIEEWLPRPEGLMFYPYASIVWRQTAPARWQWLEGDERFVGVYDIADRLPPLLSLKHITQPTRLPSIG